MILQQFADILQNQVAIIGVGGIDGGDKAVRKLQAGANLIQLYSGLVYQGPHLIHDCLASIGGYFDVLSLTDTSSTDG